MATGMVDAVRRIAGVDSAAAFDQRLRDSMPSVQDYLEQDYE